MIASDVANANNANAQLLHHSPLQSTPKAFAGQRPKLGRVGALRQPDIAARACLTYGAICKKPLVSLRNALSQRDGWLPAQRSNFGYIQKFSRRAIRFRGVPHQFA